MIKFQHLPNQLQKYPGNENITLFDLRYFLKNKNLLRRLPTFTYHVYFTAVLLKGFIRRFPLRGKQPELSCRPFFIIGSGRSGNTLLRAIINQHTDICIPPESYVLGRVIRNYQFFSFLPWPLLTRIVISEFESFHQFHTWEINLRDFYQVALNLPEEKRNLAKLLDLFYMYYAEIKCPGATRWGDKTPTNTFFVPLINKVFPEAKYIHIIRDGRDVVSSYLAAKLYSDTKEASSRWLRSVVAAQSFGAKIGTTRYLEVFYEDLVRQPVTVIQSVCDFLEIDFKPDMLRFWENAASLGDTKIDHHKNLFNPINQNSIGKWQQSLSHEDQLLVEKMLEDKLTELNYLIEEELNSTG